ncbi:MAG: hypothetical protein J5522_02585 [Lachnospiraceae bacterium]|nr:hypothetical protein [Lachnospiraceae bacterium]
MENKKDTVKVNRDPEEVGGSVRPEECSGQPEEVKRSEELPRLDNGMIDVEALSGGRKDDKERWILPNEIIEQHFNELPDGCTNEAGDKWVYNGGLLKQATKEAQRAGAYAYHAKLKERHTFREAIDIMLREKASRRDIEDLQLREDATNLDVVVAAALKQSAHGNVKAMDFLRDTVGEKPVEQLNADISGLSEADKQMLENIKNRLQED